MKNRRSFITGLKSTVLQSIEIRFLKKYKPWGVILFSRNIKSIEQTKKLTDDIKKIFNDKKYPILIDQEGGRINRLSKFIDTSKFTGEFFGNLYKNNFKKFLTYYKIYIVQTCYLMHILGVNINTVPVLDVRHKKSHNIIGDRSFSANPKIVSKIGDFCIKEFHKNNIGTVIKHIPGHGLAKVDSHKATPLIKDKLKKLNKIDFFSFKNKKSLFAMTAHIIYKDIDRIYTATHSKKIINLIRNKLKFKNLLISDDISMKSLKFSIKVNINKAFNAGCNLVLHCNGKYNEMIAVAENSPKINEFIIKKTSQFYKILS
jgi:beta-N-acetylhexosaminidase